MTSPAFYRNEARRRRLLAAIARDPATAKRWITISDEYGSLADAMDGQSRSQWHVHAPIRQQPKQQPDAGRASK